MNDIKATITKEDRCLDLHQSREQFLELHIKNNHIQGVISTVFWGNINMSAETGGVWSQYVKKFFLYTPRT